MRMRYLEEGDYNPIFIEMNGEFIPIDTLVEKYQANDSHKEENENNYSKRDFKPVTLIVGIPGKNGLKESFTRISKEMVATKPTSESDSSFTPFFPSGQDNDALVVAFTHAGKRGSGGKMDGESIETQSIILEKVVQYYQTQYPSLQKVFIVAHSAGCLIAAKALCRNPDFAEKVVFMTPFFQIDGFLGWAPIFLVWIFLWIGRAIPILLQNHSDCMMGTNDLDRRAELAHIRHMESNSLFDCADVLIEGRTFLASKNCIEKYKSKTLVITAKNDFVVNNQGTYKFVDMDPKNRILVEIDDARHSIHNDIPRIRKQMMQEIQTFFFST